MKRKTKPSAQEIANLAGVSLTLVNRKLSQGKSPRQIIAEAEVQAQQAALKRPVVSVTELSGPGNPPRTNGHAAAVSYAEAQRRKELALAGLREAELAERTGELAPVEQARQWIQHIFVPLVQGFRALPAEMRDLLPPGVAELLERRVEGLIRSADLYVASCFSRSGQPLTGGVLDCGEGYAVRWEIIAPPVPKMKPEDDAG